MKGRGFAGKILFVDLSRETVWCEPLDPNAAREYVGGLGLCIKLAADHIPPGVDPLAPESAFALGAGPMVGTDLPASSRLYVVSKLPASGTVGWCGAGGFTFGAHLKYAGFDHIVVSGRATRPVVLEIENHRAVIRDAEELWGLSVEDTCRAIWRKSDGTGVLTVGQAGENRSPIAMAFVDRISTLGRGGFGAVMGSKNLKAIVVRGTGWIETADRKRFNRLTRGLADQIRAYPHLQEWQEMGMLKSFPVVPKETYKRLKLRRVACVSCPVGCKEVVRIPEGPFAGFTKHTSSAINLLMPLMYGMTDPWEAVRIVSDLDAFGIDMFEFFGLMGMTRRLTDAGLLSLAPGEPEIDTASFESMAAWAGRMALRQGTGDLLAEGFNGVMQRLGPEAEKLAPALVKGIHPYAGPGAALPWDRFGTMELGQVLDPRGPHVGSGGSPTYFALRPLAVFPKHLQRMGVPEEAVGRILGPSRDELHVGRLLKHSHAWFATLGSLGICARGQVNRFYSADLCAELYEAATGIPTTLSDLRKRVERVWTTYRELNVREGLDPAKEELPTKWFGESGFKDYLTGEPLTRERAEEMKQAYFNEWGWPA